MLTDYTISGCLCCPVPTDRQIGRTGMVLGSYLAVGNCECDSSTLVTFQGLRMDTVAYLANLTNLEAVY